MKQHVEIVNCKHCHSPIGYSIETIGCNAKVVLFLNCEVCHLKHTLVWTRGVSYEHNPAQLNLFKDEKETL